MPTAHVNGVGLFFRETGTGEIPLVMVHGSWGSHQSWDLVTPRLAKRCRVVTYDRRGHSQSERPAGQGSVREDVADLAGLIEHLGLAPAYVAGNSFGASIALRLAGERPELLRGLMVHEPPLFGLLAENAEMAPLLAAIEKGIHAVVARIAAGDAPGAAKQFVETVALGPGAWARLPQETQQTFIENAPTFADEAADPEHLVVALESLRLFAKPVLLTLGDQSPPPFAPVVGTLSGALPHAEVLTFGGAGHIPQTSHPEHYTDAVTLFIRKNEG
jgi:pimeloyl-ACP methyl ester carboxylesterase